MVKVYFETPNHTYCERVATFKTEELYIICLPILEAEAKKQNFIVTESIEDFFYFEDWVSYMLNNTTFEEQEIRDFNDHYQNLLSHAENGNLFYKSKENKKDLFEFHEEQPEELKAILKAYENFEELDYQQLEMIQKECKKIGFTFDFYLDAQPYNLRKL